MKNAKEMRQKYENECAKREQEVINMAENYADTVLMPIIEKEANNSLSVFVSIPKNIDIAHLSIYLNKNGYSLEHHSMFYVISW